MCVFHRAWSLRSCISRTAQQVFSAEIPIRMRIDMRIHHGNAIGETGAADTLEGAYNFFFPAASDYRGCCAVVMRLGRGIKVETFRGQNFGRARCLSSQRCRSCFIRRAHPAIRLFRSADKFILVRRTFGRREKR